MDRIPILELIEAKSVLLLDSILRCALRERKCVIDTGAARTLGMTVVRKLAEPGVRVLRGSKCLGTFVSALRAGLEVSTFYWTDLRDPVPALTMVREAS